MKTKIKRLRKFADLCSHRLPVFALSGLLQLVLLAVAPDSFAWPTKYTDCVSCHATLDSNASISTATNGTLGTSVSVAAGGSFEVDWHWLNATNAAGGFNAATEIMLPDSTWTITPGTANSPAIGGWNAVWDAADGHAWATANGFSVSDSAFPGVTYGYTIDYGGSPWDGDGTGGGKTRNPAADGAGTGGTDLDGVSDSMGTDAIINVPSGASGTYTVYLLGIGHDGSSKSYISQAITVTISGGDTVKPTVTAFAATSPVNSNVNIPVTGFTATDDTAVTGYLITESSTPPAAGAAGWSGSAPSVYTAATGDGTKLLFPWAKDAAGNVSTVYASPASVLVDSTAPTTGDDAPAGWVASDTLVTLTSSDGSGSGVALTEYCVDLTNSCAPATAGTGASVAQGAGTAGVQYVRYRSTDNVGNVETTQSATLQIDKSSPSDGVLAVTPGNTQNSLSWTAASDSGSGLSTSTAYDVRFLTGATPPTCVTGTSVYSGTARTAIHSGLTNGTTYSYRVCAYDAVGNVSTGATGSGTPAAVNTQPADPPQVSLVQYQSDGTTQVAAGAFTSSSSPVIKGAVTDPDGDSVALEVEIQPIATPFTNTPNCVSGVFVTSGSTATATCGPLADGRYKWQARGKDSNGSASAWVQF